MIDVNSVITKIIEKVIIDILFPNSTTTTNQVAIKELENEELQIRLNHDKFCIFIIKVSNKWSAEHVERMVILELISKCQEVSSNENLPSIIRDEYDLKWRRLIQLYENTYATSYVDVNTIEGEYLKAISYLNL